MSSRNPPALLAMEYSVNSLFLFIGFLILVGALSSNIVSTTPRRLSLTAVGEFDNVYRAGGLFSSHKVGYIHVFNKCTPNEREPRSALNYLLCMCVLAANSVLFLLRERDTKLWK